MLNYDEHPIDLPSDHGTLQAYHWRIWPRLDAPGDELAMLCLHGFTGDGLDFEVLLTQSGSHVPHAQIWSVDLLGHGRSWSPEDASFYETEEAIRQLDAVVEEVMSHGAKRLVMMGYSMGGRLALQWALRRQEKLVGLVLVSASPGIVSMSERVARRAKDAGLCEMITSQGVPEFLEFWQQIPLLRSQAQISPKYREAMHVRRQTRQPQGLVGSLTGFGAGQMPAVWDELDTLMLPTMYVSGALDEKYDAIGRRVALRMPTCDVHVIPGAGHSPHLEDPGKVWPLIIDYLTRRMTEQVG